MADQHIWDDLTDEQLGRLVRINIYEKLGYIPNTKENTVGLGTAAALLLVDCMIKESSDHGNIVLDALYTKDGEDLGDWIVNMKRTR